MVSEQSGALKLTVALAHPVAPSKLPLFPPPGALQSHVMALPLHSRTPHTASTHAWTSSPAHAAGFNTEPLATGVGSTVKLLNTSTGHTSVVMEGL